MLVLSLVFGIAVCYLVPVLGLMLLMRKREGIGKAFLMGVLAFIVSQLFIRIPVLQLVLPQFAWFAVLPLHPWGYGLFLGLTAGLFEESARWIAISCFLKEKRSMEHGLAFGLGHGGVEAMLLGGSGLIAGIVMVLAGQGALFPADAGNVLLASAERILTFFFHVGASLLVMYGVREGRAVRYWAAAVAFHTVMDAAVVILPAVFGIGTMGIELWAAAVGGMTLFLGILVYRRRVGEALVG